MYCTHNTIRVQFQYLLINNWLITKGERMFLVFDNKTLLITGGTGSFGNAVLRRFLHTNIGEIRIFSRDEKKQDDMRNLYQNSKIKYFIGDVRNYDSIANAVTGVDFVFHAAALKQVPSCEFFPMEAIRTNTQGTDNVLQAAIDAKVKRFICLSTDKAVYPINAMGMSKALMEKVALSKSRTKINGDTVISVTRYGNVMCSRGSVIPMFIKQLQAGQPLTITDPNMTRFMMSLDDAVDLVLFAFEHGRGGEIFVQKAPACTIKMLADVLHTMFAPNTPNQISEIGTRHGEKLYESLLTREEMAIAEDMGGYYRIAMDDRDLNYGKYFKSGEKGTSQALDYTSHNTQRLDEKELTELLLKLNYVQRAINGESPEGY